MKIQLKLKDNYENQFLVTQNGFDFRKDQYTLVEENDFEIKQLLKDKTLIRKEANTVGVIADNVVKKEAKPIEIFKEPEIITDDAPKGVKEVVTKKNKIKFNKKK